MYSQTVVRLLLCSIFVAIIFPVSTISQDAYRMPPQEVVDILDAPPLPLTRMSPDNADIGSIEWSSDETILDVLYHMIDWFDRYVKDYPVTGNQSVLDN